VQLPETKQLRDQTKEFLEKNLASLTQADLTEYEITTALQNAIKKQAPSVSSKYYDPAYPISDTNVDITTLNPYDLVADTLEIAKKNKRR
jgi:hypothetical protein